MDLNERCPDDVLINIFKHLDFGSRLQASLACRRWHHLVTDSRSRMEGVAVLNIFERRIWEQNINNGTKDRLKPVLLEDPHRLASLVDHIGHCVSLKLWFENPQFVVRIMTILRGRGLRCQCLDLYPYGGQIPLGAVRELYPDLEALILRPHGPEYFWVGMPFSDFPDFPNLDTLVLESLTLTGEIRLPLSVTQMEWSHRNDSAFGGFLDRLERCPSVKYLLIGHVELDEATCRRLLRIIRFLLRELIVVVFRFVKFPSISFDVDHETDSSPATDHRTIKVAKFDLCYGDIYHTVSEFVNVFGSQMQIIGINTILEERQLMNVYRLMPLLRKREMWLQLGILQRATGPSFATQIAQEAGSQNGGEGAAQNGREDGAQNGEGPAQNGGEEGNGPGVFRVPTEMCDTVMKMDISYLDSPLLLNSLISCGYYKHLMELKFIQCKALSNASLENVAKYFFRLKRLQLSSCNNCTEQGLLHFLRHWDERRSKQLCIIWRPGSNEPSCTISSLFLRITIDRGNLLTGRKRVSLKRKKLPAGAGERLTVWSGGIGDQSSTLAGAACSSQKTCDKVLVFQDYSDNDLHWIMGFAVTLDEEGERNGAEERPTRQEDNEVAERPTRHETTGSPTPQESSAAAGDAAPLQDLSL